MEKMKKNNPINLITNETDTYKPSTLESILVSIKSGINGGLILFGLLVLAKLLSIFIIPGKDFYISINDLIISFWGFLIVSFVVSVRLLRD
jgi:hypothetical protein